MKVNFWNCHNLQFANGFFGWCSCIVVFFVGFAETTEVLSAKEGQSSAFLSFNQGETFLCVFMPAISQCLKRLMLFCRYWVDSWWSSAWWNAFFWKLYWFLKPPLLHCIYYIIHMLRQLLDVLESYCMAEGLDYSRLDGNTKAKERVKIVKDFNSSTHVNLCLVSTMWVQQLHIELFSHFRDPVKKSHQQCCC